MTLSVIDLQLIRRWDMSVIRRTLCAAALISAVSVLAGCSSPVELRSEDRASAYAELEARGLTMPDALTVRSGIVVADYEVSDAQARGVSPQTFGEQRLLAIREALLPRGFKAYRVNVDGPSPGTGLVRRYGSARMLDGGELEWLER